MDEKDLELLSLLQEECAEIIQAVSKIRRFGLNSFNPYDPKKIDNQSLFEHEVGDAHLIADILEERGVIRPHSIRNRKIWKRGKFKENDIIPQIPTLLELMESGAVDALSDPEIQREIEYDRWFDNTVYDVREEMTKPSEEGYGEPFDKRKYLLRQAAVIFKELESLRPDEY